MHYEPPEPPGRRWWWKQRLKRVARLSFVVVGVLGYLTMFGVPVAETMDDGTEAVRDGLFAAGNYTGTTNHVSERPQAIRRETMDELADYRHARDLYIISSEPRLQREAQRHADWMAEEGQLSHNRGDAGLEDRLSRAGVPAEYCGENALQAFVYTSMELVHKPRYLDSPEDVGKYMIRSWHHSAGHRENLQDPKYRRAGVGIAFDDEDQDKFYAALVLCR